MGGVVVSEDRKHPLRLAFEAREGGMGGGVAGEDQKHPPPPSDSHLKRGRGMGGGVVGEDQKHPSDSHLK
jgi:hypothetical protein